MNNKRNRRNLMTLTLSAALLAAPLSMVQPVEAAAVQATAVVKAKHKIINQPFNMDGNRVSLPTLNVDGSTYIGLRSLNNSLGLITQFNKANQLIKVEGRKRVMEINLNSGGKTLNGQLIFGATPLVQDDTTYLPLRFLLERLGYEISYEPATKLIGIHAIQENDLRIDAQEIGADGDGKSLHVYYPVISGYKDTAVQQKINAFLKAETDRNVEAGAKQISLAVEDNPSSNAPQPSFDGYYTVVYNEQGKLSLYVDYHVYLGGAHGNTARIPYTFDLATGNLITLKEAAQGNENYVAIINESIKKEIKARGMNLNPLFETIEADRDYYLNRNGLVIYFTEYEYTSYAEGMPRFVIPYSKFN